MDGAAVDTDHSGSISVAEMVACVQAKLDKSQDDSARQHITLAGNPAMVPAFAAAPLPASAVAPVAPVDTLAAIMDIYGQRDDRWTVNVSVTQPTLKIGSNLAMKVRSDRAGYVYVFYRGTQPRPASTCCSRTSWIRTTRLPPTRSCSCRDPLGP